MEAVLKGKKAIVCGSSQGIGKAVAEALANQGASVILFSRNLEKLKSVVASLNSDHGQKHEIIIADFSNTIEVKMAINSWIEKGNTADILINNTGGPKGGAIADAPVDEFLAAFNQHLICNHILAQAVIPGMKEAGSGRIVNIISTSVKQPLPQLGVSNTIRGAVANWSKTLANELGQYNITVNNVLPGATNTERLQNIAKNKSVLTIESVDHILTEMAQESPMKRIAEPAEIAAAVAFLTSPAASYINGINIPVDGGRTKSL
jgi:3-oxoacyl-[acyl-carrier protein] reductase